MFLCAEKLQLSPAAMEPTSHRLRWGGRVGPGKQHSDSEKGSYLLRERFRQYLRAQWSFSESWSLKYIYLCYRGNGRQMYSVEITEIRKDIPDMKVPGGETPGLLETLMSLSRMKFG